MFTRWSTRLAGGFLAGAARGHGQGRSLDTLSGGEPDEAKLGEGAGGPALLGVGGIPGVRFCMMLVTRPGQREQHVRVEQGGSHVQSSASSSFARLLGMISAPGRTLKTGSPPFRAVCVEARSPRRASWESTSPRVLPEAWAWVRAASNTSSSKVTVVLIRGYGDAVMPLNQAFRPL
jgi:hypothetical protein